jgi:hypothetical protein
MKAERDAVSAQDKHEQALAAEKSAETKWKEAKKGFDDSCAKNVTVLGVAEVQEMFQCLDIGRKGVLTETDFR